MNQEFLELKEKAKSGDNVSQYKLAVHYIEGKKIQKDVVEGCKWLESSAKSDLIAVLEYASARLY